MVILAITDRVLSVNLFFLVHFVEYTQNHKLYLKTVFF